MKLPVKKEYLALMMVIAALSLYLVYHNPNRTGYRLPEIKNISGADITRIEISKPGAGAVLNKTDNRWTVREKYAADADKVQNMLNTLGNLTLTALVSESGQYDRYDLTADKKITVKAWSGDKLLLELDLGKPAPSYRHTFVKLAGDDRVYHARENLRNIFDQNPDNLRDKTVLSFNTAEIQELHLTRDNQSVVFTRTPAPEKALGEKTPPAQDPPGPAGKTAPVWQGPGGSMADQARLNGLLAALSGLKCERFIDDRHKKDFAAPIYSLKLKGPKEHSLFIFPKAEKESTAYPAFSSDNDMPFLLPDWRADSIMPDPDQLLAKPETP
ncbi:MAG: DUF4340 domain-containing protein [Desulfobacterales bacterium]|nr:DUF4340 domain-containing protein [Desulfobacterales bacterium]